MDLKKYNVTLVKEECKRYETINRKVDCPKKIADVLTTAMEMENLAQEIFVLLAFDTKKNLIGLFEVSRGTISETLVHPAEIFKRALVCNAHSIAIAHNHPSGNARPSSEDKQVTERIKRCGEMMGIPLIDHVIIGDGQFYSFVEDENF